MKHINKSIAIITVFSLLVGLTACGKKEADTTEAAPLEATNRISAEKVDVIDLASRYGMVPTKMVVDENSFFAEDLCVIDSNDIGVQNVTSEVAEAAGVFNVDQKKVTYAQDIHGKIYPASTTKIMTLMLVLENVPNLDEYTTVSKNCVEGYPSDSSMAGLKEGDVISIRELLYGLMLPSGNDAACCLAEYVAGSEAAFAEKMNEKAASLGCTNTHFVTTHGLHDDEHYTTTYDMYLIFKEAIKNPTFVDVISTKYHKTTLTNKAGKSVVKEYYNGNRFISVNNRVSSPKNITVIGGKTGTTEEAGYCLVLLSKNQKDETIISIVYNANCRANLYYLHQQILNLYGNE